MNKGTRTRRRVVERCLQLFSVKGYYNTSIGDILEATEMTKGGLYGHFKGKKELWYACYEQAVLKWRAIVFKNIRDQDDPLDRIERVVDNHLLDYLGNNLFQGGCFFLNSMLEMTGQSQSMSDHLLRGFTHLSRLFERWLEEAKAEDITRSDLNSAEVANFIVVAMNGASALYAGTHDASILKNTSRQLRLYVSELRKEIE